MTVTRKLLADTLIKYINRQIDLSELVSWAEEMMRENDFENGSLDFVFIDGAHDSKNVAMDISKAEDWRTPI